MKNTTQTRQSFLHGAIILVAATVIVKIIGAVFKIPLSSLLTGTGMGYFNTAYYVFNTVYTLATAGLPAAVARMVSECATRGKYKDVRKIMRVSSTAFCVTGILGVAAMVLFSDAYVNAINNQYALMSVICMAPALFFCCMMSSYRGYYEGLQNMYPTAFSQAFEAVVKLIFGLALSAMTVSYGFEQYKQSGKAFGTACTDSETAKQVIYSHGAAAAILGIVLSTMCGFLYLFIRHRRHGDGISEAKLSLSPEPESTRSILGTLMQVGIPISLGALAISLTNLIDVSTIQTRLAQGLKTDSGTIFSQYPGLSTKMISGNLSPIPNFMYGAYSYGVNIFNLVPTLTTALGISALPSLTSAWVSRNSKDCKNTIETILRVTSLIAVPAGLGISVLAEPILNLIYGSGSPLEVSIAAPALRLLGIAVIFVALLTPITSMLQAVGRAYIPVILMLFGGTIKIATNYFLVAIPQLNIKAAPIGTTLCYLFLVTASLILLVRFSKTRISIADVILKPAFCAVMCAVSADLSFDLIHRISSSRTTVFFSMLIGVTIYIIFLFLTRTIKKSDILMLPKGKIIAKVLENYKLIG